MPEIDETRFKNLENRQTKIEEYIKCSEEVKEQQWKDAIDEKLRDIKAGIKEQGKKSKKIADITVAMGSGLVLIVFAGNFAIFSPNPYLGYAFLAVGSIVVIGSLVCWCRLNKHNSRS